MPDSRLKKAVRHHQAGRLPEAESLYRAILAENPNEPDANHNLGDIAFRAGKVEQAVALLQKALMADPQNARNWNSLINVLIEAGYPDDALKVRKEGRALGFLEDEDKASERKPGKAKKTDAAQLPEIARRQLDEAESLLNQGRAGQAINMAAKVAAKYPGNGHAQHVHGTILVAAGKSAEAIPVLQRAHKVAPDDPEILGNIATSLQVTGQLRDAAATYARALEIDGERAEFHSSLAAVLQRLHDYQRAREHAGRALEIQPECPEALNILGAAWEGLKEMEKARQCYARALKLKPDYFAAHINLGNLHRDNEEYAHAEALFKSGLELRPNDSGAWHNLGSIYKETGRPDQAKAAYRKAVELAPDRLLYIDALCEFIRFEDPDDPLIRRLKQALQSDQISDRDKQFAGFVLGKAMLDLGRSEEAWGYYQVANKAAYQHAEPSQSFAGILPAYGKLFDQEFRERIRDVGRDDAPMVLVVGFSRSGKSLIESLLAGHPELYAQGERGHLETFFRGKLGQAGKQAVLDYMGKLRPEDSRADADEYLHCIGRRQGQRPVNTRPGNVYFLGLLALLLPKVPIIFCRRNLMDLGLACYFKSYRDGNRHSYNLEDLGRHIRVYEAFIDLWLDVLPNPMLEVNYEELVADPDTCARRLYEFVGLDYRAEYLDILENHRELAANIGPAHSLEAPSPIREDFVGSAQPFLAHLVPLSEAYQRTGEVLTSAGSLVSCIRN